MSQLSSAITQKLTSLEATLLRGHHIFNRETDDYALERRFSKSDVYPHNVSYEFTHDMRLLRQYYSIRDKVYKDVLEYYNPLNEEDDHDPISDILIVKSGGLCVGGARGTAKYPGEDILLPMETEDFKLRDVFPNLDLARITHAEVSRVALLPEFANGQIIQDIYEQFADVKARNTGVELVFFATYKVHARKVRQVCSRLGYKMVTIDDVYPEHFKVSDKVSLNLYAWDLTADSKYYDALKSRETETVDADEDLELELA